MFLFAFVLPMLLLTVDAKEITPEEGTAFKDEAKEATVCERIADIGFALDSSGSVGHQYQDEKNFLKSLTKAFGIRKGGTHAGVVTFSTEAELSIKFNQYYTQKSFEKAVDNIHHLNGFTFIGKALKMVKNELFAVKNGARPNVEKVCILITDGTQSKFMSWDNPVEIAAGLRAAGIHTISIGIGSYVKIKELTAIAGSPKDVYTAANFEELNSHTFLNKVEKAMCNQQGLSKCQKDYERATYLASRGVQDITAPDCKADGSYAKVQCRPLIGGSFIGGCFCVDSKTGTKIPGTFKRHGRPSCGKKIVKINGKILFPKDVGRLPKGSCAIIKLTDSSRMDASSTLLEEVKIDLSNKVVGKSVPFSIVSKRPLADLLKINPFSLVLGAVVNVGWCKKKGSHPWIHHGDYYTDWAQHPKLKANQYDYNFDVRVVYYQLVLKKKVRIQELRRILNDTLIHSTIGTGKMNG